MMIRSSLFVSLLLLSCLNIDSFVSRFGRVRFDARNMVLDMSDVTKKGGKNQKIDINGCTIFYDHIVSKTDGARVVFLPGLIRQKNDAKSTNLQAFARRNDFTFLCSDYRGVGRSGGSFA